MDGTFPLACPYAIPSVFVYKEDESMLWHIQVKEERYQDNEMVLPTLSLFISFSSVSQLSMTSKPNQYFTSSN